MKLLLTCLLLVAVTQADAVPLKGSSDDKIMEPSSSSTPPIRTFGQWYRTLSEKHEVIEDSLKDVSEIHDSSEEKLDLPDHTAEEVDQSLEYQEVDYPLDSLLKWLEQKANSIKVSRLRNPIWRNRQKRSIDRQDASIIIHRSDKKPWKGWSKFETEFIARLFEDYIKHEHQAYLPRSPDNIYGYETQHFSEENLRDIVSVVTLRQDVVTPTYPLDENHESKRTVPATVAYPIDGEHFGHGIRSGAFVNHDRNGRPIEELKPNREAKPYESDIDQHVDAVVPEVQQSNIVASAGYSADSQQIAPQLCYNAIISSTSGQQGYIKLDTAISFSDLQSELGISVEVSGKFGMFSADAEASYVRSLQDKDYSLSLNYYEYTTNKVSIQLAGYGEKALTENGKTFYNDGKNPYFGLLCGDNYITSYDQGALLAMALNIKFRSSSEKTVFEEKAGATFGSIFSASESVKSVVSKYNIHGSVIIQAFQIGGDPSQLSKVLNKDQSGNYYALTCSLTSMDNCVKAASGLLDYAREDFSTQFSFQNNTGLTPLGISFSQFIPIRYVGLIPPPSLVTEEVAQYRDELSNMLKENEYYKQKLYPFFNQGYPVQLDPAFIKKIHIMLSKTDNNVRLLMQPHNGAADCFNVPDECKSIKSSIESQLQNITIDDLKIFEDMKYSSDTERGCQFWNTGGGSETSWAGVNFPGPPPGYHLVGVNSVSITDTKYHFVIVSDVNDEGRVLYTFNGTGYGGLTYNGTMCYNLFHCWSEVESKQKSPFYFEAYNVTD